MFLEKGDVKVKTEALKRVIYQILNGDKMPGLLMVIIRFVLPSQNHMIKKLLLIFWEIVPKLGPDGKLLQEMILVCDAYRKVHVCYLLNFLRMKFKLFSFSFGFFTYRIFNILMNLFEDQRCGFFANSRLV